VQTQDLTVRIEASGSVIPISTVNVSPKSSGQLAALYVDQGDQVKAGQIVARMDSETPKAELAQAKAQLAQAEAGYEKVRTGRRSEEIGRARAQVAAAQAQADLNRERAERYRSLARKGAISQDQLDEVLSGDRSAHASLQKAQQQLQELTQGSRSEDIQSAAAQVAEAQAQVDLAQTQMDDTVIRAPFDGIVTQKYATVGAIVTPTTSASTTASATSTSIVALVSELEIKVNVPETDIAQVKNGQRVEIVADAYPDRTFEGRVRLIAPEAVIEQNVTSFQVRVKLVSGQLQLRSGMNVDVTFIGEPVSNALVVPTVAIVTRQGKTGVLVADEQGKEQFRTVTVGFTQDGQTLVLKGLRQGERVFIDFPGGKAPSAFDNRNREQVR
jgi:HlyD family secretion protein